MHESSLLFTPLESPAVCSGDEGNFLAGANPVRDLSLNGANTWLNAPVGLSVRRPKVF